MTGSLNTSLAAATTTVTAPSNDKPYGIAQIRAYIPIQLDLNKLNYDVWRELFETHCSSFGVLDHVDGSSTPYPETEKQWKEHDGLVKMWIYGTVSEQLLDTILKARSTTRDIWLHLETLFRDNKEAQAIQFDNELRTLEIGDMTVTSYTHKLKTLFDFLRNLDSPVSERTLVMLMLNGLSDKCDSIINVIKHQAPFPSFPKARSMLIMEEMRLDKQVKPASAHNTAASSPSVMYTESNGQQQRSQHRNNDASSNSNSYNNNGNHARGRGRGRGGRGRGRGRYNNNYNINQWPAPQHTYPPWLYGWPYASPYGAPPPSLPYHQAPPQ